MTQIERARAVCGLCGDMRVEEGENAWSLHMDLEAFEEWIFPEWGTVCGDCQKQYDNLESIQREVERKRLRKDR